MSNGTGFGGQLNWKYDTLPKYEPYVPLGMPNSKSTPTTSVSKPSININWAKAAKLAAAPVPAQPSLPVEHRPLGRRGHRSHLPPPTIAAPTVAAPTIAAPTIAAPIIATQRIPRPIIPEPPIVPREIPRVVPKEISKVFDEPIMVSNDPNKIYYGNSRFINNCIDTFNSKLKEGNRGKSGSFGTTLKLSIETDTYFVKRIVNTPYFYLKKEIDFAEYLTSEIPDYVSNLKGAFIDKSVPEHPYAFLIYEGPNGMVLNEFIERFPPKANYKLAYDPDTKKSLLIYSKLYCLIVAAKNAMKTVRIVHRDIKPANIYIVTDDKNNPIACKLFDFGLSDKVGDPFLSQGSPSYTPVNMRSDKFRPATVPAYSGTVSSRHNDYSVDVIWNNDFKMQGIPKPNCTAILANKGGKRKYKKTRKNKNKSKNTRKSKSS